MPFYTDSVAFHSSRTISDHFSFLNLTIPVSYPAFRASVQLDLRCGEWQGLNIFALSLLLGDVLFPPHYHLKK